MNTNSMRKMVLTSMVCWLGAMPALALAHGPNTLVSIHNRFDGKGEVYVDGQFRGVVEGNSTATFPVRPGCKSVSVQRPGTHFVLAQTELHPTPGTTTRLTVEPPRGAVRVTNAGDVSVKIHSDFNTFWIAPGRTALVNVETGNTSLNASIADPRGEWVAIERTLWVEPGQIASTTLKPDPTVLTISNYERYPVRALVDGAELGWITPGDTQRTWIRPGPTQVVLLDRYGRVRSTTNVVVRKGGDASVVLSPQGSVRPPPVATARGYPGPVVVNASWSPTRPGGPARAHHDGDGCRDNNHDERWDRDRYERWDRDHGHHNHHDRRD